MDIFGIKENQKSIQELLLETRNYVGLQKRLTMLELSNKLSTVLSRLAVGAICIILGAILLLFIAFSVAFLIGQLTGSTALGFAIVTILVALLFFIFYINRYTWVITPIVRMIVQTIVPNETQTADELRNDIASSKAHVTDGVQKFVSPTNAQQSRAGQVSQLISRGMAIYQGARMALTVINALNTLFGKRKRRR